MRIRLRAPGDEADVPSLPPRPASAQTSPHTQSRLPPVVDVRSPDFIEQRLENLKRKPTWLSYLDQYVKAHPDDDDDETGERADANETMNDAEDDQGYEADDEGVEEEDTRPGYVRTLLTAMGVVALTPVWVVTFPLWRNKGTEYWPIGSSTLWDLYKRSLWQLAFFVLGIELLYYVICKELPTWGRETWYVLQVELEDMLEATKACRGAVARGNEVLIRELCAPIAIDVTALQLTAWATIKTHRRWGRFVLLAVAGLLFVDVPGKINKALQPLPVITGIDQPYALLDEEILVAFNGKNLQPGGTIAWVSYWGCASTSLVATCDLQFPTTFDKGFAAVTFTSIDHFIPCYRNPPNPLKAEEFRCFEHVRLPVKDMQSIPGWSRSISYTAPAATKKKEKTAKKENTVSEITLEETLERERAQEIAYARRLAEENERVKGTAPTKRKDEKRSKPKPQQKVTSVSVDASSGDVKDDR